MNPVQSYETAEGCLVVSQICESCGLEIEHVCLMVSGSHRERESSVRQPSLVPGAALDWTLEGRWRR